MFCFDGKSRPNRTSPLPISNIPKINAEFVAINKVNINAMESNPSIKLLSWDSQFFGFKIGRITINNQDEFDWYSVFNESKKLNLACLYMLADPENTAAIHLAEEAGFRFMDVRLTMSLKPGYFSGDIQQPALSDYRIRTAEPQDLSALQRIARISHQNTRFYADPHFSQKDCDRLYEVWIENSLSGYAQQVFVAENSLSADLVGYITCHIQNDAGKIGLIAVDPAARRYQIGYSLVQKALDWFIKNGADKIDVVTQGSSRPATNLYQKAGFQISKLELWFHKWFYLPEHGKSASE